VRRWKPKTLRVLVILMILLPALAGCTATKPRGPLVTDYFPLEAGNSWTYQVGSGENAMTVDVTAQPGGKYQGNETTAFYYRLSGNVTQVEYYAGDWSRIEQVRTNKMIGGYATGSSGATSFLQLEEDPPLLLLDLNALVPPYQWQVDQKLIADGTAALSSSTAFTAVGFETVTVPAGNFPQALHIRFTRTIKAADGTIQVVVGDRWFAPGVGLVKAVDHMGSVTMEMLLKGFTIR